MSEWMERHSASPHSFRGFSKGCDGSNRKENNFIALFPLRAGCFYCAFFLGPNSQQWKRLNRGLARVWLQQDNCVRRHTVNVSDYSHMIIVPYPTADSLPHFWVIPLEQAFQQFDNSLATPDSICFISLGHDGPWCMIHVSNVMYDTCFVEITGLVKFLCKAINVTEINFDTAIWALYPGTSIDSYLKFFV